MTPDLKDKLNLYEVDDIDYEGFRDVLTDNAIINNNLLTIGEKNGFGNLCSLEAISHNEIKDFDRENKFLLTMLDMLDVNIDSVILIHSKYYLHTQAEDNIKIDIVWNAINTDNALEYQILGVYFESTDNENGEHNYDPGDSAYWEEWLVDFDIKEDPNQ